MESISVSRTIDAPPDAVREAIEDVKPFMEAAGFDRVDVDDETITIVNGFAVAAIELLCDRVDDPDAVLAYEQREGIFEEMQTAYTINAVDGATEVTATTDFALDVAVVGGILDATVIKRQRRRELNAQFDHLESLAAEA